MLQLRSRLPVLGVLAATAVVPIAAITLSAGHMVMIPPFLHLYVVGLAGLLAGGAAVAMSIVAAHRNDGHGVWLGMAFSVVATMLVIHALATPGPIVGANGLVQLAGVLNLPVGGTLLAASGLSVFRRPRRVARLLAIQLAIVGLLAIAGGVALAFSHLIPMVPTPSTTPANAIFAFGSAALFLLSWRAARTFLLTRRPSDLLVATGISWLIGAQFAFLHYGMMDGAFWTAHLLEVGGIGLVAIPAALDLRFAVASRPLQGRLRAADLVRHEEAFLGGRVRALLVRLGEKDPSTEGHTRRVATLAVAIGERLGLTESRLRQLALGGLLHDMGKLSVPDEILKKPGRLTDEEFAEIRKHPTAGRALLSELGGFSTLVLDLVESHHERLDGAGYPNHVPAAELDLEVRILTVADVFDALTADRVYRDAWPLQRALALLEQDSGTAFDAACVTALRGVVGGEQEAVQPAPRRIRPSNPRYSVPSMSSSMQL
jgi:HD-GYP domain-containing protein (c-di-GMP phosphodiesterase class II)